MSRAEQRRKQREQKKADKQMNAVLRQAGFPEFQLPPAPMRTTNLSDREVANITGTKIAVLEQWRREQTEEIKKACIAEAQEKLDTAETFITVSNIIVTLSALEGFHWAKSASNWILEHYQEHLDKVTKENIRETYEKLHKKWGIEMEFDVPDLNILMGFDEVDWTVEYIGRKIPYTVYEKVWNDSKNIQSVFTQLAVLWELCEEFGFAKHKKGAMTMLDKFMEGTRKKHLSIDAAKHGARDTLEMLSEKYEIDVDWSRSMQETIDRFDL